MSLNIYTSHWLWSRRILVWMMALGLAVLLAYVGTYIFRNEQDVLKGEIKERLRSTAAAAAMQFNGDLLDSIHAPSDIKDPLYHKIVQQLLGIEANVPGIRFAYIMRKTRNPEMLAFVADADSLKTPVELDVNGNGVVDANEQPSLPGDLYDASHVPAMRDDAFLGPAVDPEVTMDQWGALISGYAPIHRWSNGETVAILGIDMTANDYEALSRSSFSPFTAFLLAMGGCGIIICFLFDARRRRIEFLETLDDERGTLINLALHQLGTPLSIMQWEVEMARETNEGSTEFFKAFSVHVDECLARMNGIMEALRDAERIGKGLLAYQPKPVDLTAMLTEEVTAAQLQCDTRKQTITCTVDEPAPWALIDRQLTASVVRELLSNASGYSPRGSIIAIRVRHVDPHWIQIEIADHGCGIPAGDLPLLFQKFFRASNAVTFKPVGNGLGLFIARGIVERARGSLWAESVEGKGTTFFFTLPKARRPKRDV